MKKTNQNTSLKDIYLENLMRYFELYDLVSEAQDKYRNALRAKMSDYQLKKLRKRIRYITTEVESFGQMLQEVKSNIVAHSIN